MRKLPGTLAVLTLTACGPTPQTCVPERVASAPITTFRCADGRACGAPQLDPNPDGGPDLPAFNYQSCPGENGCPTFVHVDGGVRDRGYC